MNRRVLIIDDDPSMLDVLSAELGRSQLDVVTHASPHEALAHLGQQDFGVVLSDMCMSEMTGADLCRAVGELRGDLPVIVMTAFASLDSAVASIRAGAYDFVTKPLDPGALTLTIERALRERALSAEVRRLRAAGLTQPPSQELLGDSPAMRTMCGVLDRAAATDATLLITGESGTGKEVVARALHARSARASGPFVGINCAAVPEALLESELFGHVKGAYTDAHGARPGLFQQASGGTLLLDEVGEMPLGMQAKLLRALQQRTVRPVGGDLEVPFDARILAATNRDLEDQVSRGLFREDLLYRINVLPIEVPPLRQRGNDVLLLAQTFLLRQQGDRQPRVVGMKAAVAERLLGYPWPGNVRELQNCVERAVAFAEFDHLGLEDLPARVGRYEPPRPPEPRGDPSTMLTIDEVERRYVSQVLGVLKGNKTSAARLLGIDRRTLYRKLERWSVSS